MAAVRSIAQIGMDEQIVNDSALEDSLEQRQSAKQAAADARKAYSEANELTNAAIEKQELPDGMVIRVGRFRIERTYRPGRSVSFETQPGSRVKISLLDDGD
jgi:hypothetical protein